MPESTPLKPLASAWHSKIKQAVEWKKQKFSRDARKIMRYFNGKAEDFWNDKNLRLVVDPDEELKMPGFRMVTNKAFEFKSLYGPTLYYQNPYRLATPRALPELPPEFYGPPTPPLEWGQPPGPPELMLVTQQEDTLRRARMTLMQSVLNYLPDEQDAKFHMRRGVDEALVKGMGVWITEYYTPPGYSGQLVGSFWISCDDLVWDPDAEHWDEDVQWVAYRCVHPTWEWERMCNLPKDSLKGKGNFESQQQLGESTDNWTLDYYRKMGQTNDLLVAWKVYSKMGMGDRMTGIPAELKGMFEGFGDYCYLIVAENVPYPLNLPSALVQQAAEEEETNQFIEQAFTQVQWPIPFWIDGGWPCTVLGFHWSPDNPYPISPLRPGLGELQFLNWAYSFMAGKVKTTCRDFIVFLKSAEESLKKQILNGGDLTTIEIDGTLYKSIHDVVQFLQHAPMNGDLLGVVRLVEDNFDKRVGLIDEMYGRAETQSRTATDANVRGNNARIRPDDMAQCVDSAMTEIARKEALACYWGLTGEDVKSIIGTAAAMAWDQLIGGLDPETFAREYDFRIEAGSTRRPNKDTRVQQMNQAIQTLGQVLQQFAMATGQVAPLNALIAEWCKATDIEPGPFLLAPPPPPPMQPPPDGNGENPGSPLPAEREPRHADQHAQAPLSNG